MQSGALNGRSEVAIVPESQRSAAASSSRSGRAWRGPVSSLTAGLGVLSAVALVAIVVILCLDVFARNVLGQPLAGTVPYVEVLLVTFAIAALPVTQKNGGHIAMELITSKVAPRVGHWLGYVRTILVSGLLLWMVVGTLGVGLSSMESREVRVGLSHVPAWPVRLLIPVALVVLLLQVIVTVFRSRKEERPDGR